MIEEPTTLIGSSPAVLALYQDIEDAARVDCKILIVGESGVGKEVTAKLIHGASRRRRAPLTSINCAAIPETLLESELFGYERGSFTGAYRDRLGLLEQANGGTVLLDEVGEMTPRMQGLLLRFLETGEIQRVGSTRVDARVDVRIIAATNRNLLERTEAGLFREDLYYRLNVFHILIPPIRERPADIPELLAHFFQRLGQRYGVTPSGLSREALDVLVRYSWPGNVRELKNVVERLVVRLGSQTITPADLPREILGAAAPSQSLQARPSHADVLYSRMVKDRESFWSVVYGPFMARDLTRADLTAILARGLEQTAGNYKLLVELFNMNAQEYKRFLNFLRKHQCHVPFQQFRTIQERDALAATARTTARGGWCAGV